MFHYLRGKIEVVGSNMVSVDCGGVGFLVTVTTATLASVQPGTEARLFTHCSIREDAFDIYGFSTQGELEYFRQLIAISGVGPKAAISILSTMGRDGLLSAVIAQDEKMITRTPGVGKKLAQRILMELKDKITDGNVQPADMNSGTVSVLTGTPSADAVLALESLGYDGASIRSVLKQMDTSGMSVQDIIRKALGMLSGQI